MTTTSDYLAHLFRDAGRVELRHQIGQRWDTSWYLAPDDLLAAAGTKAHTGNLFTSLHHVGTWRQEPIANDDVDRYCRILFDFDPERKTGTASTDSELAEAQQRASGLRRHLAAHGWPEPALAMSGNGYHLQYRTALPNTEEGRQQLTAIYLGLFKRFSDDVVTFDRAVRNPGRICTLYGSIKRKGIDSKERPHRCSMITVPRDWRQVLPRQIDKLANAYSRKHPRNALPGQSTGLRADVSSGQGDYSTLDVATLFAALGLYKTHIRDNIHAVACPWAAEHTTPSPANGGDTVIFEGDGSWPGFHCKHSHCVDRTIRDVISLVGDQADQFCVRAFERRSGNV